MMVQLIITEFQKMKRYSILWVGIAAVLFSALLALFQQTFGDGLKPYESYTNSVLWNNFSLTFPFMIVLIGGYIINSEYTGHTLKNLLTVPVSFRKLLTGKVIVTGLITALYGLFSFLCTFVLGLLFCCGDMTPALVMKSFLQLIGLGLCCCLAVLPIMIFSGRKPNGFLAGTGLAFVYGFCGIFVAGRVLADYYPITAGLGLIGYTGDSALSFHPAVEAGVMVVMAAVSGGILFGAKEPGE